MHTLPLGFLDLGPSDKNNDRKMVKDTAITAMHASAWTQKIPQMLSTCPLIMSAAATLTMLMMIANTLRHNTEPRANFFRREIFTRQRRATGMEMTMACQWTEASRKTQSFGLRITSVKMSKTVDSFTDRFSLNNA